jgi:hypothetical protein
MGCEYSELKLKGKLSKRDVESRFNEYVERCEYDHGHAGYTGTMAEAQGLTITDKVFDTHEKADEYLEGSWSEDLDEYSEGACQKWGPAIAVKVKSDDEEPYWLIGAECSA